MLIECPDCDGWGYDVVVGRHVECGHCKGSKVVKISWWDRMLLAVARKFKSLIDGFGG